MKFCIVLAAGLVPPAVLASALLPDSSRVSVNWIGVDVEEPSRATVVSQWNLTGIPSGSE